MTAKEYQARDLAETLTYSDETDATPEQVNNWGVWDVEEWLNSWGFEWDEEKWRNVDD